MYYEVYIDTLFLVNFVMNLYLIMMVNITARRTATRRRMIAASVSGALIYCLALLLPWVLPWIKLVVGTAFSGAMMVWIAFRPRNLRTCLRLIENLAGYSFLLGGALLVLTRYVREFGNISVGLAGIMGIGGILYMLFTYVMERRKRIKNELCRVILQQGTNILSVNALLDTGNGLTEPVSGKPVCVVNRQVLESLWPEGLPEAFRAIPYHSVGCAHGIMKGYMISQMTVEFEGVQSIVYQVYLGAGDEQVTVSGNYEMILNPRVIWNY